MFDYLFGGYIHAAVIAEGTGFIAVNGAGTAGQVTLDAIRFALSEAEETGIGMGGTPYGYDACADQRGKMHVTRVHGEHEA